MDNIDSWIKRAFSKGDPKPLNDFSEKTEKSHKSATTSSSQSSRNSQPARSFHKSKTSGKAARRTNKWSKSNKTGKPANPAQQNKAANRSKITRTLNSTRPSQTTSPAKNYAKIQPGQVKIVPLGGLNEVGKNMMALETANDIVIIDMGFEFPGEDMLGIDYVIPDVSYLEDNKKKIRGVVLTHGHLDHIGGIPYILPKLNFPPVFGSKFAIGLSEHRIKEFKLEKFTRLNVVDPDKPLKLGEFLFNFFRVNHSVPDAMGVIIDTPAGKLVHTGDFKFDKTPLPHMGRADMHKMRALGTQNVLALFCESTNALKPGHTMSEKEVGETLDDIIKKTEGRLIIASFSSQIYRIQQILNSAEKHGRKVYYSGRSLKNNIDISSKLGFLKLKQSQLQDIRNYKPSKNPDNKVLILTTGSQGEAVSALSRIAKDEHSQIRVKKGDTIIFSSTPIIGNERAINTVINNLCIKGAQVIHNQLRDVHTSGHARQDELVEMINMVRPKFLIPIHGEYYMRQALALLAQEKCRIPENRIIMLQNGDVLLAERDSIKKSSETIETKYILIDGRGEGHLGSQVQVDREMMSLNGALIVLVYVSKKTKKITKKPDVVTRGFIYMHESEEITRDIIKLAEEAYRNIQKKNRGAERKDIKRYIKQTVDKYTHQTLERRPLIIPLIVET